MKRLLAALALLSTLGGSAAAYGDEPRVVKLAITPAARPVPALRYRLYPAARELRDGNAAGLYYRAILLLTTRGKPDERRASQDRVSELMQLPAEQFPRDEARKLLAQYDSMLNEIDHATNRRTAQWDIPLYEDGVSTLLMEVQEVRGIARVLALQARLAVVEEDFPQALASIRAMLVMAHHVGESGTLVSSLVGVAIAGLAHEQIEFLSTRPNSPNLYWALTALPEPLVSAPRGFESEQAWLEGSLPYLDVLEKGILSQEQAAQLTTALGELVSQSSDGTVLNGSPWELDQSSVLVLPALSSYAECKRQLIERGLSSERAEAMPVVQVLALRWVQDFRDRLDEQIAFTGRPYAEVAETLARLHQEQAETTDNPERFLSGMLLPAVNAANVAFARLAQRIALMRVIEAVRLYAADHHGRLPAQLTDIHAVPIPNDPGTGAPFKYELKDNVGILLPQRFVESLRFELTVAK
ncbi:MAG: hypothetical protein JNG90_17985 [Planctomycetaceae bacterium]|nr:hypothetical protein [Planctomycetaceae bacterium]